MNKINSSVAFAKDEPTNLSVKVPIAIANR